VEGEIKINKLWLWTAIGLSAGFSDYLHPGQGHGDNNIAPFKGGGGARWVYKLFEPSGIPVSSNFDQTCVVSARPPNVQGLAWITRVMSHPKPRNVILVLLKEQCQHDNTDCLGRTLLYIAIHYNTQRNRYRKKKKFRTAWSSNHFWIIIKILSQSLLDQHYNNNFIIIV
jgi:hypothetical protein